MTIRLDAADLPDILPVFPLQGALLLPGGKLSLNIFEPRYLAMTEDAIAGPRLIGMIQPREKERIEPGDKPEIYGTGCVGRILSFSETDDGRYLITLRGLCRFNVREELSLHHGYRRVEADYAPWAADLTGGAGGETGGGTDAVPAAEIDRDRLLGALRRYLERQGLKADWKAIEDTRTGDLVSVMSMLCPFAPSEKQALLEAADDAARAEVMVSLMEMQAHAQAVADDEPDPPQVKH